MVHNVLKQHFMECQLSCTSALPWAWVLEILARSSQVDLSLLLDLVRKAPEASDGIYRNVRELVFLRILERIYIHETHETSASLDSSHKIGVDPSESCEDIFLRISPETSALNIKAAGAEMFKWDIKPYIEHKRFSLAKCSLEQVKDAIQTGSHPSLVSLRELSGLPVGNQPETDAHVDLSDCNSIKARADNNVSRAQICAGNDQLVSHDLAKSGCPLSENLSLKRKRSVTTKNTEAKYCKDLIIWEDSFEAIMKTVKKYKPDCIPSEQDLCTNSISLGMDRQRTAASLKTARHGEIEMRTFEKESCRLGTEPRRLPGDVYEEPILSKEYTSHGEVLPCEKQVPHHSMEASTNLEVVNLLSDKAGSANMNRDSCSSKDNNCDGFKMQNGASRDGNNDHMSKSLAARDILLREKEAPNDVSEVLNNRYNKGLRQDSDNEDAECGDQGWRDKANEYLGKSDQNIQRSPRKAEKKNACDESGHQHDEIADIARRKESFLSSQCMLSQGSLADDWSELNLCVKCSKGENVLVCCSNSCPVAIHENCLVSVASFDKDGKFYCPFCAYSQAVSEYQKAKEKASAARNSLAKFIFAGAEKETEKEPSRSYGTSKKNSKQVDGLPKCNEPNIKRSGPSGEFCYGDGRYPVGGAVVGSTDRPPHNFSKQGQERRHRRLVPDYLRDQRYHQMEDNAQHVSEQRDEHPEIRSKNGISGPAETGVPCEHKSSPSAETANTEEISEEEYESSADADQISEEKLVNRGASKNYKRLRKVENQVSYYGRKPRLVWTSEEEEKLREAVRVNYNPGDVIIPWKKILEYGAGTFHENRTAGQLKDKWRNLSKSMD